MRYAPTFWWFHIFWGSSQRYNFNYTYISLVLFLFLCQSSKNTYASCAEGNLVNNNLGHFGTWSSSRHFGTSLANFVWLKTKKGSSTCEAVALVKSQVGWRFNPLRLDLFLVCVGLVALVVVPLVEQEASSQEGWMQLLIVRGGGP